MMAFCALAEGFHKEEAQAQFKVSPDRWELFGQWKIRRKNIVGLFTADFWSNYRLWSTCDKYGMPYSVGWAEHPAPLVNMLRIFDTARIVWQNWKATK